MKKETELTCSKCGESNSVGTVEGKLLCLSCFKLLYIYDENEEAWRKRELS